MIEFRVAIPARFGSARLPGKPMLPLAGKPMIAHVVARALDAGAAEVVVATDDERIAQAAVEAGAEVFMSRVEHASGTDRLAECAAGRGWNDASIVVNLQGDEPLAPPAALAELARLLHRSGGEMATLASPLQHASDCFDPNCVKLVCNARGEAMYFSRAPIPWERDRYARDRLTAPADGTLRHIGVYAYRVGFLKRFAAMPPARLEQLEALEQLRVLAAGVPIHVGIHHGDWPAGVDTEADLQRVETLLRG
jgi:3-deoxy-manno-octulosonate cytidylyltransferase (CMP-KDO synthetase)